MKKQQFGWAVVIAVLSMAIMATSAGAMAFYSANGTGDALIFPYFDADKDNIVCISNESASWMQIHVRLRTGSRSVEGRDFPLILSPGDMVVFNVTRNGYDDGMWRVETDMDPNNFKYVRINSSPVVCLQTYAEQDQLKNSYLKLEPQPANTYWTRETKDFDEKYGYIEVIGEAVFDQGLDKAKLLNPQVAGYYGCTNTWQYVNVGGNTYKAGNTLSGVPNVLTGKMYIMDEMYGTGVAYNATALADFRTNEPRTHRVENYPRTGTAYQATDRDDVGVILVSENSAINADDDVNHVGLKFQEEFDNPSLQDEFGDYTYEYYKDGRRYHLSVGKANLNARYESMISANNTWGPTLADGDAVLDNLDTMLYGGVLTSVREVEAAIRRISIRGHYFAQEDFETKLVITFPTKHHVAFNTALWDITFPNVGSGNWNQWLISYTNAQQAMRPTYKAEIWDIDENTQVQANIFDISPRPPVEIVPDELPWEMNILTPALVSQYSSGRFLLYGFTDKTAQNPFAINGTVPAIALTFIENIGGDANVTGFMTECHY